MLAESQSSNKKAILIRVNENSISFVFGNILRFSLFFHCRVFFVRSLQFLNETHIWNCFHARPIKTATNKKCGEITAKKAKMKCVCVCVCWMKTTNKARRTKKKTHQVEEVSVEKKSAEFIELSAKHLYNAHRIIYCRAKNCSASFSRFCALHIETRWKQSNEKKNKTTECVDLSANT